MRQAICVMALAASVLAAGGLFLTPEALMLVAGGALSIMAALIAGTFLWLWQVRATPLALGMGFSWSGLAILLGPWMALNHAPHGVIPLVALSCLCTGAALHFATIQASFGLRGAHFLWPIGGAIVLAALRVAI